MHARKANHAKNPSFNLRKKANINGQALNLTLSKSSFLVLRLAINVKINATSNDKIKQLTF